MAFNGGTLNGKRNPSEHAVKQLSAIQTGAVPVNPNEAYGVGWSVKIKNEGPGTCRFSHREVRVAPAKLPASAEKSVTNRLSISFFPYHHEALPEFDLPFSCHRFRVCR
jgi:hypothetical protein